MNKTFTYFLLFVLLIVACQNSQKIKLRAPQPIKGFVIGDSVLDNNIKNPESLIALIAHENSTRSKLRGIVKCVCKKDGAWLKLDNGNEKEIMVSFRDKAFSFPQSITGKEVVLDGEARLENLSVAQQKNFALEDGAGEAEISKITATKEVVLFETTGLVVLEKKSS